MPYHNGSLWDCLNQSQSITIIGAGGKTTALLRLAQEGKSEGRQIIATTSTKVYPLQFPAIWKGAESPPLETEYPCFWYREQNQEEKWVGPHLTQLENTIQHDKENKLERIWLVEGDGAKGRKLKYWADFEPQIPSSTEAILLMINAAIWGNPLDYKDIHRPEYCPLMNGQIWNAERFWEYLKQSPLMSDNYLNHFRAVLLNDFSHSGLQILKQIESFMLTKGLRDLLSPNYCPRFAAGNVMEGVISWLDL